MSNNQKTNLFLSLYGVNKSEGCIVITGTIGIEKTTMCRMILENVARKTQSQWTLSRFTSQNDLLGAMLQNFSLLGKSTKKCTKIDMIYQLTQLLLKVLNEGERALLVIEDTQNSPLSVSDQTRIVSSLETQKKKLVQIILIGQDAHMHDLKTPIFERFFNLEKCAYTVPRCPIKEEEIEKYIEHHLMRVDSTDGIHFSPEALEHIRKNSLGIPSITNLIFDSEITSTFTQMNLETKEEIVENAIENLVLLRKEAETIVSKKSFAWSTRIKGMKKTLHISSVAAIFVSTGAILSKKVIAWSTRIKGMKKTLHISSVAAIFVSTGAILSKKVIAWSTRIKGMKKTLHISSVVAIFVSTGAILSKKVTALTTRIKGMKKTLHISSVVAIFVSTGATLSKKVTALTTRIKGMKKTLRISSVAAIFVSTGAILSKKVAALTTRFKGMKRALYIPSIAAIFVSTGAIGFFIYLNILAKKNLDNKLEDQAIYYSHNIMDKKDLGQQPKQERAILQEKMTDIPEEIEKKEQFNLAVSYQKSGDFVKAWEQYEELIKRYPMDHEIRNNLGFLYQVIGDFDTAIIEYKNAILIKPDYQKARNNLVIALYKNRNLRADMNKFNITLKTNPKDVQRITTLGIISKKLKHPDRAIRFFEHALARDPAYPAAHYNLGVILEGSEVDRAAFHFEKFLELSGGRYASLEEEVVQRMERLFNKPGQ